MEPKPPDADPAPSNPPEGNADPAIASVRSILLAEERERIQRLERQLEILRGQTQSQVEVLQTQTREQQSQLEAARQAASGNEDRTRDLQAEVEILHRKGQADSEGLTARITPVIGGMLGRAIRDSRDEMAESLGPVMSEAIRVQIRNSRQDMVEALYPIIGETVQRAVSEFARELQRNIDARLRAALGPQGIWRTLTARLRGVSPAELALRDALPFTLRGIFLIQRGSG
ncbi:MAG: hypothetical protein ACREU7_04550, partial [Burkholderiales bacterium]